jgi:integrase
MPAEDVEKVMRAAATHEPETVPYFALCLFAGIRPQGEIGRMTWTDINFERREIDIRADTSKTGDERFIEMSENLVTWLLPHRRAAGPICGARAAVESVREKAGVRWEADCMRHSFASYHLAQHDNAGKTALQMGHRTLGMLFEHYRRAVRKEDALAFWAIRPVGVPAVVELRANAG